jgi:hypothetical protein
VVPVAIDAVKRGDKLPVDIEVTVPDPTAEQFPLAGMNASLAVVQPVKLAKAFSAVVAV